ncbi:hypothetical protein TIFTF001_051011 [Ficus carica]|uniref:Uncharacterized protein n=1 Tax=Ficus carica TaxID=3494 RepID=A0AA87YW30_FICCA|nr:hypothetical protein TIFTF001_051011 [Ficus carica]
MMADFTSLVYDSDSLNVGARSSWPKHKGQQNGSKATERRIDGFRYLSDSGDKSFEICTNSGAIYDRSHSKLRRPSPPSRELRPPLERERERERPMGRET